MRHIPLAVRTLVCSALSLTASCTILAPEPDLSRFFTLTPTVAGAPGDISHTTSGRRFTYGLGPITIPAYLDRDVIVTRESATEISYSSTDRWAEPLQRNVSQVLLRDLSVLLGTDRIVVYPWPTTTTVDYQIQVDVLTFDCNATGNCQLIARWAIRDGRTHAVALLRQSAFTRAAASRDAKSAVAELSAALGELSKEIEQALQRLAADGRG